MSLDRAVRQVRDLDSLLELLRDELDWPLEEGLSQDEMTFEWTSEELCVSQDTAERFRDGVVRQLRPMVTNQPWGIFFVEFTNDNVLRGALRGVLRGLVPKARRDSNLAAWQHDHLLFICTTSDYGRFAFGHFEGDKYQRAKLSTFGWEREDRYIRTLCEHNLPAFQWPEDDGEDTEAWLEQWSAAFDKEPLTRQFFKQFDKVLEAAQKDLVKHQGLSSAKAYSRAQLLLERLIFLYFLQKRGWLDQKPNYLLEHFAPYREEPEEFSYYEEFLESLFWTLASAPGSDGRLEGIPFLNGGLFDDDEFALTDERRKRRPPLRIRNRTFQLIFDELLEAFNFTVCEDTPLDQEVAVDPEMLGKVFESLILHAESADPDAVAPDKRKQTGSYYTPRIVVHFICREALLQYLVNNLPGGGWKPKLKEVMEFDATDGFTADDMHRLRAVMTPEEGRQVLERLDDLKCCDPAVGSGAFPVGLMHELVRLRRVVEAAANGYVDPVKHDGREWFHRTKAYIVENCLYGVDIQQQAIEICRLRLWLSLVVDYDIGLDPFGADRSRFLDSISRMSQLPNLEMNFRRGDSLHDHVSGIPVLIDPGVITPYRETYRAIQDLGARLHKAKNSQSKKKLRLTILKRRLSLTRQVLQDEARKMSTVQGGLFGQIVEGDSHAQQQRRLNHERKRIADAVARMVEDENELEDLRANPDAADFYPRLRRLEGADFDSPFNFVWRLDFPAIFGRENPGFDIVVGNPPFVTVRNREKRELYRRRWPLVCHGKYHMVCPFFALSFGLLRKDGELAFIVSNAFAARDFGRPLVEDFFPKVGLAKVVDCSGLMFPGHGTPTCIVFGAPRPSAGQRVSVIGILPGGGDLRTPPEKSSLWKAIQKHHDATEYEDHQIAVSIRSPKELENWPWNLDSVAKVTQEELVGERECLRELVYSIGPSTITRSDQVFLQPNALLRRIGAKSHFVRPSVPGDSVRDWQVSDGGVTIFPYSDNYSRISPEDAPNLFAFLRPFKRYLENIIVFGKPKSETGHEWWEYTDPYPDKNRPSDMLAFPEIATHAHFTPSFRRRIYPQTAPAVKLPTIATKRSYHLLAALLNSSAALFWLKQVCFSKRESAEAAKDTYYVFAGGKVQELPVPDAVAQSLKGGANDLADCLAMLAEACWKMGQDLNTLALRKLFENPGEAYYEWNSRLPGYVPPNGDVEPFEGADSLRATFASVVAERESLRQRMIARQEEMDWLVYKAYGLIDDPGGPLPGDDLDLEREMRPFCLWARAEGGYDEAVSLIPDDWSEARRKAWMHRLALIRDNEHIRRIEKPVYKRRWDEQWKVGTRWECGQPAYDQEFLDAFDWWLSEKAEAWLEYEQDGGPAGVEQWADALWQDACVQAAWQVTAEARHRLENWKRERDGKDPLTTGPKTGRKAFDKHFKTLVRDQSVPEGIPWAVPWDDLEEQGVHVPTRTRRIRGKLNVPRERFRETEEGLYKQARPLED